MIDRLELCIESYLASLKAQNIEELSGIHKVVVGSSIRRLEELRDLYKKNINLIEMGMNVVNYQPEDKSNGNKE